MESMATNVRVTPQASRILGDLSVQLKKPKAQIIEQALRDLEERIIWQEVHDAYAIPESEEMRKERELWDTTVADGIEDEEW